MQFRSYLIIFMALVLLGFLVADPMFYLLGKWEVKTLTRYITSEAKVVYLGDSVVYSASPCDRDKRTINDLTEEMAGVKIFPFTHAAFSPVVYRKVIPFLARFNPDTRVVVMPLSLGFFSEGFRHPTFDFPRKQLLFDTLNFDFPLRDYLDHRFNNREQEILAAWEQQPLHDSEFALGKISEINKKLYNIKPLDCTQGYEGQQELMKLRYQMYYGNRVTSSNEMLGYIQETLERLTQHQIKVVLYLSPVNLDAIRQLGGGPLHRRVVENLTTIHKVADARGWPLIDLSSGFSDQEFGDRFCACGHLRESGRRRIAQVVAARLKKLMATQGEMAQTTSL